MFLASLSATEQQAAKKESLTLRGTIIAFFFFFNPYVARLYDVYESHDRLHFIMENLCGGELFNRLVELGRFPENDAAEALRQMLLALSYVPDGF